MYCGHCSKRRQNRHISDDYRSNFCQACRKAGHDSVRYCKFCGWSVREENHACAYHIRGSAMSISSGSDGSDDASYDATDSSNEVSGDGDQDMDDAGPDEEENDTRPPSASLSPLSWSSLRVSIQEQRVKCSVCNFWFDDAEDLETHEETNGASCREHGMCFPQDDLYDHAREYAHKRCFVPGCNSAFAKHDHSDDEKVEDHVYYTHARRS